MTAVKVEDRVKTQLWAATSKDVKSGEHYEPVRVTGKGSIQFYNDELAEKL